MIAIRIAATKKMTILLSAIESKPVIPFASNKVNGVKYFKKSILSPICDNIWIRINTNPSPAPKHLIATI